MSWRDILKDAKTISQTSGSFDFEEEEIPEQDEKDCKEELKKIFERAKNAKNKYKNVEVRIATDDIFNPFGRIPEELICEMLDAFKGLRKDDVDQFESTTVGNWTGSVLKNVGAYSVDSDGGHKESMETSFFIDKENPATSVFYIIVEYDHRVFEKNSPTPIKRYEEFDENSEEHKEFVIACKEIFGEYY